MRYPVYQHSPSLRDTALVIVVPNDLAVSAFPALKRIIQQAAEAANARARTDQEHERDAEQERRYQGLAQRERIRTLQRALEEG